MAKFILDEEFYCCKCGNKGMPVIRQVGKERSAGHLKKLWCLTCNGPVNHAECIPNSKYTYNEFMLEYKYHNFDEEQNRIMPFGEFKNKLIKEGVDIYE